MIIRQATEKDAATISKLASEIWWPTYRDFVPAEQIALMLQEMYTEAAIIKQLNDGLLFLLAERDGVPVAFAGCSVTEPEEGIMKLHKLYILPSEQGKGTGKALLEYVTDLSVKAGATILELNVNRSNPALGFYQKSGFTILRAVDIPYHQFILDDYIMRKTLV